MCKILNVSLELVRPGPAHNQLLSPLTTYVALCGDNSPVSVHLPFEHHHLRIRLQRLRYELAAGPASEVQTAQRQAEVSDMGQLLGNVLAEIPGLLAELSRARSQEHRLVHLRLLLAASELGMVPFETAIAADGFPGTGSPLFLQSQTPITITREIRRGYTLPMKWDRQPRILFAFASPQGLTPVPAEAHLKALREAIDPWVKIKPEPVKRVVEVKKFLTVLPDASLQDIRECCAREHFTHVHILAHGAPFPLAGDKRFGLALCQHEDKSQWDVVEGESLAIALTGKDSIGAAHCGPTLVSLATCDSGNLNSVMTPGGSIAHALHMAGIPWVVASQFPLWMKASTLAAHELYRGLLEGEDPRWVLYGLRQKLCTDCPATHDWASLIVYATLPPDFDRQVEVFRNRQVHGRLATGLNRLDDLFAVNRACKAKFIHTQADIAELECLGQRMREMLAAWRGDSPPGNDPIHGVSTRLGMSGALEKRLGNAFEMIQDRRRCLVAYRNSREFYSQAVENHPHSPWLLTQYLAMRAIPFLRKDNDRAPFGIDANDWWLIASRLTMAATHTQQGSDRIYALADLLELEILGSYYGSRCQWHREQSKRHISEILAEILQARKKYPIPAIALERQLMRYHIFWKHSDWDDLAAKALAILCAEDGNPETEKGASI